MNAEIRANAAAETRVMSIEDAMASGAMALFGEKYGAAVRVLSIGDFSVELCGGTHVQHAGDIGLLKIVSETGIASGVRRIEAVTGANALQWIAANEQRLQRISELVKGSREDVDEKVSQVLEKNRALEKALQQLKGKLASSQGTDLAAQAVEVDGIKVLAARLDGADNQVLRDTLDQLKNKLGFRGRGAGYRERRQGLAGGGCDQGPDRPDQGRGSGQCRGVTGRWQGRWSTRHGAGRRHAAGAPRCGAAIRCRLGAGAAGALR